nr:hypothetical protein [Mycobacterium leprae]
MDGVLLANGHRVAYRLAVVRYDPNNQNMYADSARGFVNMLALPRLPKFR